MVRHPTENLPAGERNSIILGVSSHATYTTRTPHRPEPLVPQHGWILALLSGLLALTTLAPTAHGDDWASLWIGSILAGQGNWHEAYAIHPTDFSLTGSPTWRELTQTHTTANVAHPFVHNPGVALALIPLTHLLTFNQSLYALTFLSGVATPLIPAAAHRYATGTPITLPLMLAGTLGIWVLEPFRMSIALGQTTPLILAAITTALALAKTRPEIAAPLLATAALIKLTPIALIIGLALIPNTRKTGIWSAGAATAGIVPLLALLPEPVHIWVSTLQTHNAAELVSPINASVGSVLHAPLRTNEGVAIVRGASTFPTMFLTGLIVATVIGVFVWNWWGSREFPEQAFLALCVFGPMCVAGIVWIHYSLMLVFAVVVLCIHGVRQHQWGYVAWAVLVSFFLAVPFDFSAEGVRNPVTMMHLMLWVVTTCMLASLHGRAYQTQDVRVPRGVRFEPRSRVPYRTCTTY